MESLFVALGMRWGHGIVREQTISSVLRTIGGGARRPLTSSK